jgi:hypothetical protein
MAGETAAQFCAGCIDFAPALARYETGYRQNLTPAFSRAAALRRLLSLPEMLRWPIMKVATLPRIAEFIFSKTRSLTPSASQV